MALNGSAWRRALPLIIVLWLAAVAAGLGHLWAYAMTPGPAAAAPASWPATAETAREDHIPTLVLFLHPQCACSSATINELAVLLAHVDRPLRAQVWIYRAARLPQGWEHTSLWNDAAAIPGVRVVTDIDGKEARRFGARVSGETMLFDGDGRRLFHGGITAARGHQGDNAGRAAVTALLNGWPVTADNSPVFGCLIHDADL